MHRATSLLIFAIACGTSPAAQSQQPIDPPVLAVRRQPRVGADARPLTGSATRRWSLPCPRVCHRLRQHSEVFWSADLSPNGKYSKAAIVHDYLYWTQGCTREQADNLLDIAMKESNVSFVTGAACTAARLAAAALGRRTRRSGLRACRA
jgi:hypothetical protein